MLPEIGEHRRDELAQRCRRTPASTDVAQYEAPLKLEFSRSSRTSVRSQMSRLSL